MINKKVNSPLPARKLLYFPKSHKQKGFLPRRRTCCRSCHLEATPGETHETLRPCPALAPLFLAFLAFSVHAAEPPEIQDIRADYQQARQLAQADNNPISADISFNNRGERHDIHLQFYPGADSPFPAFITAQDKAPNGFYAEYLVETEDSPRFLYLKSGENEYRLYFSAEKFLYYSFTENGKTHSGTTLPPELQDEVNAGRTLLMVDDYAFYLSLCAHWLLD